ncbi:sigma-70 family RNA polymerase sigma factor [Adhaeribacter radiodurans]|uniref:Sigma-70 family RNA polymerase sigma factor n=1 Tax=Adhaeribacter radiodurans TaxID=2745197 RepID=A0A7L7L5V3_9BACT|nr:sigma-70 family RNA polymerase sigma factor [Adhaeribacter radiodurans]QMU28201.1 sigma-70 family RNA polymerase sigma factor [Adhaeribacter radiodurans]
MVQNTEEEIIQRILEGQLELFEILIRRNNPFLYKVGKSYGYQHQDVEDLMQETFISAYKSLGSFQHRSSFKTWIIKIMLSHCYQKNHKFSFKYEKAGYREIVDKNVPLFSGSPSDMEKRIFNQELKAVMEKAVNKIPLDYRMVFSLRELNGLSVAETAEALAITEVNVKVRLNRAKNMLRKEIEKYYSPEEIFEFNLIHCDRIVDKVMNAIAKENFTTS